MNYILVGCPWKLLFFISIKKSLCTLKFMALLCLVQISRSRFPQLSPCHNRTQITLKSKQEYPGLVTFTFFSKFYYFKQKGWYFFSPRIRFGTCRVRPSESTVELKVSAPANFAHFGIIFSGLYFMVKIYISLHWQHSSVLEELKYIKINYAMSPKRCL